MVIFMLPVVFATSVEFLIRAVYMGGLPVADHVSSYPGNARTMGAESGNIIMGEANNMT